jgi:hypothetical protein
MRAIVILFFLPFLCFAQVGINTTNPNASLDIRSSNVATPTNTDGILIPKIDEYPTINPTVAQDGMLVYASGNGSVTKGFYYWNNTTTTWVSFSGTSIEKIDDLLDGKSDYDGANNGSSLFLGVDAGLNDDGSDNRNVGIGNLSLRDNTTGLHNTAVGFWALVYNTEGNANSAFGANALQRNSTGHQNSAFGTNALFLNTTGQGNSSFGYNSMYFNETGSSNTAIGRLALQDNTSGDFNVSLGYNSGRNTNGNRNVFIGYDTGSNISDTKEGSVFIGARAGYHENNSNRLYIENSTSSSPLIYGEFDADFLRVNGDFEVEKTSNASTTVVSPFGFQSSLRLFERGIGGDYGFEFQYDGTPDKLYLWSRTFAGNEGIRMTWLKDGKVGMNDIAPDARLDIEAINQATPSNTDGILIPRIGAFPSTNPGANQNGMLVFLTSDSSFYFWNNGTTLWQKVNVERINDLADGKSDNDGSNNGSSIFLGINAGANDDSSDNANVGIGYYSLHNNTSGTSNTATGSTALLSNTSGSNNSAFGRRSLYWTTTGSGNSAFGSQALEANTTGYSNTAIGYEALTANTTGYHNTAIGYEALESNVFGRYNTAIGYEALANSNGVNNNTAVGYQSLTSNSGGVSNTAIGFEALESNTNGSSNVAVGFEALKISTTGYSNTAVGYEALEANTLGDYNTALGYESLERNTSGNYNTALGYEALSYIATGNNNTAIGYSSGPVIGTLSNTTAIGYNAVPLGSNWVHIGNSSVSVIGGSASWSVFSDRRLKTNIKEDIIGLEFIKKLRPVSYNLDMDAIARFEKTPDSLRLRDAEQLKAKELQTGFIAQEVETVANEVGFDFHGIIKPYDSGGIYALRYAEFVVPLVKAMQEQQDIIETQQEELKALKREIEEIKALLRRD